MSACSKSPTFFNPDIDFLPFQEEKDSYWGMISPDGNVLFSGEFKEEPTVAMNGRFFAKNGDGLWELYTAEEKPKKLGEEYLEVTLFSEDVAPVVRKNQNIELIDLDGKTVCTLDKVEGNRVLEVYGFSEGIAVFRTAAGYGCIDTSGKVVIQPKYAAINPCCEGKLIAVDNKYKAAAPSERKYCVLDKSGNIKSEFSVKNNIEDIAPVFKEGLLPVEIVTEDSKTEAGLMNEKGEWVVRPSSKTRGIDFVYNGHFVFNDGEGSGVKNIDGETVIRAKYKSLVFASDEVLIYENEKGEQGLIDLQGNKLTGNTYDKIYGIFAGKYLLVQEGKNNWTFIDKEGKPLSNNTDIYDIGLSRGNTKVSSDYFSYEVLFSEMNITKDGFGRYGYGMTAAEIAGKGTAETKPESYTRTNSDQYSENILKCNVTYAVLFTGAMAGYDDSNNCHFSKDTPRILSVMIPAAGKLADKSDETYNAAKSHVAKIGKFISEEGIGAIYDIGNGRQILVANNNGTIYLFMNEKQVPDAQSSADDQTKKQQAEDDDTFQPDNRHSAGAAANSGRENLSSLLSTRRLTYDDIKSLNKAQLRILRNEIYARHGYIFKSEDLKSHFSRFGWYKPRHNDVTAQMSETEKYNAAFIKKYE